ncbi:MAG TPA: hypothetical protein VGH13_23200 [Xanthobacteraceae bacterium]|jgi:hypothetical protein
MNKPLKHIAATHLSATRCSLVRLPARPDSQVLSTAIPLFYIGQNKHGFWVVREAAGRNGGSFLRRQSALCLARDCEPEGCATMFLGEPLELDVENQGNRLIAPLTAAIEFTARRLPAVATFVGFAAVEWHKLVAEISRALAGERRNRAAIERELFHGEYRLISKNDDDLPIS